MKNRSSVVPFLLIGLGVLFLLSNLGIVPHLGALLHRWWPLVMIVVGAGMLLRRS